ncbi:MAG TPA: ribosome maturation factor RimM [Deltaproteobacteria bacterium]|jgi:16S rRNA processing protein RimM|nr:ribosome maturation factor RimM [Deltaproteobacteria bacterium]HOI08496.1 ribosome maturation factor RimM [Deltaproteobacteria bacterium]
MEQDLVEIGRISSPKGLKGLMWIIPYGDSFERFQRYSHLMIGSRGEPRKVLSSSQHKGKYLVSLEGITDRSQVEELKGQPLFVLRSQLEEPGEDEHYWHDLLGMTVQDLNGRVLGTVVKIFSTGSNDVYVVDEEKEYYIPATKDVIRDVSLETGVILIDSSLIEDLLI